MYSTKYMNEIVQQYLKLRKNNLKLCYNDSGFNKGRFITRRESKKIAYNTSISDYEPKSSYGNPSNSKFGRSLLNKKKLNKN